MNALRSRQCVRKVAPASGFDAPGRGCPPMQSRLYSSRLKPRDWRCRSAGHSHGEWGAISKSRARRAKAPSLFYLFLNRTSDRNEVPHGAVAGFFPDETSNSRRLNARPERCVHYGKICGSTDTKAEVLELQVTSSLCSDRILCVGSDYELLRTMLDA